MAAMTRQGMLHGLVCCLCMKWDNMGSGTAVTGLFLGQSQQAKMGIVHRVMNWAPPHR